MSYFVLVDLDHTISDATWRDHLQGQWEEYNSLAGRDQPIPIMIDLVNSLANPDRNDSRFTVVISTARQERWRGLTMDWLFRNRVWCDELLMRRNDDFGKSPEVKMRSAVDRFGEDLAGVTLVIDDREDVLVPFRARGITTLLSTAGRRGA